tara:strand:+ start:114 stop:3101 length:2988 start_codon:yes stop_codon:yes gene_type:complete
MNNVVTTNTNTNVVVVTAPGPAGVRGPQGIVGPTGTITGNTGVNSTGSSIFSGSVSVIGALSVTGSVTATSFSGSGAGLFGIPASGITGLNLSRVASGSVSASVGLSTNSFTIVSGSSTLLNIDNAGGITGSAIYISGSAVYLNGPTIRLYGNATLNDAAITTTATTTTDRIQSGTVTASVATLGNAFTLQSAGNTIYKISTAGQASGSFLGDGSGLVNIPASGIVGLNLSQIASTTATASISAASGFQINTNTGITGSLIVTAGVSGSFSGSFQGNGSGLTNIPASGITGLNLSRVATGSVSASVNIGSTPFEIISGSSTLLSLDLTGKLAVSKSINVGIPTSNNWQSGLQGSYFNNFTPTSDVSEILRFIAGLLSQSAPDASPNTRTFGSISETITNTGTVAAPSGIVPQSTTTADIIYLTGKGFTAAGSTIFSGKTIYNSPSYGISYNSVADGATSVSSSADAQLFGLGLLSSGNATSFFVSGAVNWFYSDNNSETVTATSQSQNLVSNNSFGTSNGVTIAKINTVNPAVIPPAYQDGKFATVFSSGLFNGGISFTNVSSSGWYHISASIIIATGSSDYSPARTATERIFWAPVSNISIPAQTITFSGVGNNALTATSRSLSGAPYLLTSTFNFASTVNGVFNPLYTADSTIASMTEVDSLVTTTGTASVSTTGGTIQTATAVFDSTGVTARNTGTVPFETDIIKMTGSAAFSAGDSGATNIATSNLGTTSFILTHAGKNRSGTSTTGTQTISYHTAGTFGQPSTSGSLAYYGRTSQTYDGGSLTGQTEAFTGEAYRIQLNDNVTTFTGNAWNNSFGLYNLGGKDLQVKPGNLIRPGSGTYGYWLTDPDNTQDYKYYIRRFQRTSVLTSFTLNVGKTLVPWEDTSSNNAVAVGIIFESAKAGASNCRLFDPVYANGSRGITFSGATVGTNPFTSALDYYGAGGGVAGTTYTITVQSPTNMVLNGTAGSDEIYVIIRYKGDPLPVTSLTVSGT